jgi:hypothetical protein
VWEDSIVKQTKKGEKKYGHWMAGWREGDKVRKVYLGSCRKMSQAEALQKARAMKAEALSRRLYRHADIFGTLRRRPGAGEIIGIERRSRQPVFLCNGSYVNRANVT